MRRFPLIVLGLAATVTPSAASEEFDEPMGLSSQMPAYGEALTFAEIAAIVAHLKTLAETSAYPPGWWAASRLD